MNIKTKKLLRHLCMFSGLMLTGNMAHAACSVSASGTSSISVPSIYLMENGENSSQFNSGLSCTGFSLALANMTYQNIGLSKCQIHLPMLRPEKNLTPLF